MYEGFAQLLRRSCGYWTCAKASCESAPYQTGASLIDIHLGCERSVIQPAKPLKRLNCTWGKAGHGDVKQLARLAAGLVHWHFAS